MENIEIILSIAAAALGLLVTAVTFIIKSYKAVKAKLAAQEQIRLSNVIPFFMSFAEGLKEFSGAQKKSWVIDQAQKYAGECDISIDVPAISAQIEELIELTKKVNVK